MNSISDYTLNDFRSILGKRNDGDVAIKKTGENGPETLGKVNYGRVYTHEPTTLTAAENNRIRMSLVHAILSSAEGRALEKATLNEIAQRLGYGSEDLTLIDQPLSRRELKAIFDYIDDRVSFKKLCMSRQEVLAAKGVVNKPCLTAAYNVVAQAKALATKEGLVACLPKKGLFNGFPVASVAKFVSGNMLAVQDHLVDKLFWKAYDLKHGATTEWTVADVNAQEPVAKPPFARGRDAPVASKKDGSFHFDAERAPRPQGSATTSQLIGDADAIKTLVRETVTEMMRDYGAHREPGFRTDALTKPVAAPQQELANEVSLHFRETFDKVDALFFVLSTGVNEGSLKGLRLARLLQPMAESVKRELNAAYLDNHNSLEAADARWQELSRDFGLDGLTADEIRAASEDNDRAVSFTARFQDALLARLETEPEAGSLSADRLFRIVGEELKKQTDATDVAQNLKKYVAENLLVGESDAGCLRLAQNAVASMAASDPGFLSAAHVKLMRGDPTALEGFRDTLVEAIRNRGADQGAKTQRLNDMAQIARAQLEYIHAEALDDVALGKLATLTVLMSEQTLTDEGILSDAARFIDTPENREAIENLSANLTFDDVDFACHYIEKGVKNEDYDLQVAANDLRAPRPFFNGLRDGVINIREMCPEGVFELSKLINRYNERKAGGPAFAENEPMIHPQETKDAFERYFEEHIRPVCNDDSYPADTLCLTGDLGTADVAKMLKLLKNAGIRTIDLNKPETAWRLQLLTKLVELHAGEDVLEWAERIGGKSVAEMSIPEMYDVLLHSVQDPLDKVEDKRNGPAYKTIAGFLGGRVALNEAHLAAQDLTPLLAALRDLSNAPGGTAREVTVSGVSLKLVNTPAGGLKAVLTYPVKNDMVPLAVRVPKDAAELARQIENALANEASNLSEDVLKSILPDPATGSQTVSRTRELCTKVICAKLNVPAVRLSSVKIADLHRLALRAAAGTLTVDDLSQDLPTAYNSQETIELHEKLVVAQKAEKANVKMPEGPAMRTREERIQNAPPQNEVRDMLADLFMNKETWSFDDAQETEPGARIRKVIASWEPEIAHVVRDIPHALASVPASVRGSMQALLEALRDLGANPSQASAEQLAALERKIAETVDGLMTDLQASVTRLFDAKPGEDRPLWEQSFAEMTGTNGLDLSTPNGRFLKKALDRYFTGSGAVEKRAMLSAMLRNTQGESTEAQQVAELLKGAGPILQKMLQGLPIESFGPETQVALKDMKSRLAPIPEDVVRAQMLELIRSSGGQVTSVQVIKPIGAATVAQTFLCHIKTKEHPVTGEDVVIKLLRPNALTVAQREYAFFAQVAQEEEGMAEVFRNQYEGILEEFDFTHEAENVDLGVMAYDKPNNSSGASLENIRSMHRHPAVPPSGGLLVLSKVGGTTYDNYIETAKNKIAEITGARSFGLPDEGVRQEANVGDYGEMTRRRQELIQLRDEVEKRRTLATNFTDVWLSNALLGDGFLHGDLHAGNLMTDGTDLSVIDYGNAMRLTKQQQQGLLCMMTSAMAGLTDDFLKAYLKMVPEEKDRLQAANANGTLTDQLKAVFAKGTSVDGTARLAVAMAFLQRAGLAVPAAVTCFTQSLNRLQAVVTGLDDVIHETENSIGSIRMTPPTNLPELPFALTVDGVNICETLERMIAANVGEGTNGPNAETVTQLATAVEPFLTEQQASTDKLVAALANRSKEELADFCGKFLARYAHLTCYYDHTHSVAASSHYGDIKQRLAAFEKSGGAEDRQKLIASLRLFLQETMHECSNDTKIEASRSRLPSFADLAVDTVTNDVDKTLSVMSGKEVKLSDNQLIAMGQAVKALASAGGTYGTMALKQNRTALKNRLQRIDDGIEAARKRNALRDENLRVTARATVALDGVARDVRLPDGTNVPKATDRDAFVAMLKANLRAARRTLKSVYRLENERPLAEGESRYFADVLNAATDGGLAAALAGLDENALAELREAARTQIGEDAALLLDQLKAE